jgi:predicted amidohydrolase YtcJ
VFAYSALSVPRAEAMAARGGRVLPVGSRDDLESLRGTGTETLELGVTWTAP